MMLDQRLRAHGHLLFRWRSFVPVLLLPMAVLALAESGIALQSTFGKSAEDLWEAFSIGVALCGVGVRVATAGWVPGRTSGRNTRSQRAESLNTAGMYSIVRNPLYLGNFLVMLGFVLAIQVWWFVLLACFAFLFHYERIILSEEAFLRARFGKAYEGWASRTPAFLPNPLLWRPAEMPFCVRTVLRREYNGFYLVVVVFSLLEFGHDLIADDISLNDPPADWVYWIGAFMAFSLVYLVLRFLKRHTQVLRIPGR